MKLHDPQIVSAKANSMIKAHLDMFSKHLGDYEASHSNYYFYDSDYESLKLHYEHDSKLLTKVFCISLKITLKDVAFDKSWNIKSFFAGNMKLEGMYFKSMDKTSKAVADFFNSRADFIANIFEEAKKVDLQNITISYNQFSKTLTASINPYAGAFVWIKLPPMYHDVRLKEHEIEAICNIKDILRDFLNDTIRKSCVDKFIS